MEIPDTVETIEWADVAHSDILDLNYVNGCSIFKYKDGNWYLYQKDDPKGYRVHYNLGDEYFSIFW